jgi:thiamine pyrophosphokinase
VIFANGELNDGPMVRRALAEAEGALVVAADGGARMAQACGLDVDAVIGDMDSLTGAEVAALRDSGATILSYPEEKDETDLELALLWAAEQGATWIRIIGAIGQRFDQTISNVHLLALPALKGCDVRLVAWAQQVWLLHPPEGFIDGAPGDTVSLLPLSGRVTGVRTDGLRYPLHNETLALGPARGVSNVMAEARARVRLQEGVLLVVHTLGRA